MQQEPFVIKRNGKSEPVNVEKITRRLARLRKDVEGYLGRKLAVSIFRISRSAIMKIYDGITTSELDEQAADECAYILEHPDYAEFAGHIMMSNLERNNRDHMSFAAMCKRAYDFVDDRTGLANPLITDELYAIANKYGHLIDKKMDFSRNYRFGYFAFRTLTRGEYLLCTYRNVKRNRVESRQMVPIETPQHMYMRVALGIYGYDLESAFELYDQLSLHYGSMATPTLFNAGRPRGQLSSCFLLTMHEDSIDGIYKTLGDCAMISKNAGGIGLSIHNVRAQGSYIAGTNGVSNGIIPMLKVFNATAKYVDQGGGKRKGSFAKYLEPWHADVFEFLEMRLISGAEEERARDLFYALWMNDLYYKRLRQAFEMDPVEEQANPVMWSIMCPKECPDLCDKVGKEFEELYERYERAGKARKQVPIKLVNHYISTAQIETGLPYVLNKDHCNRKSNQKNLGTIRGSNLCAGTKLLDLVVLSLFGCWLMCFFFVRNRRVLFARGDCGLQSCFLVDAGFRGHENSNHRSRQVDEFHSYLYQGSEQGDRSHVLPYPVGLPFEHASPSCWTGCVGFGECQGEAAYRFRWRKIQASQSSDCGEHVLRRHERIASIGSRD